METILFIVCKKNVIVVYVTGVIKVDIKILEKVFQKKVIRDIQSNRK